MITVITGPMWSRKSTYLIDVIEREENHHPRSTLVFKPRLDSRDGDRVASHDGRTWPASMVDSLAEVVSAPRNRNESVYVDEAQFLAGVEESIPALLALSASGAFITFAGLDLDFRGRPFPAMGSLLAVADSVRKRTSRCACRTAPDFGCYTPARYTQRIHDGVPITHGDSIQVGGEEIYEPRCPTHFVYS